ncbi:MAG: response regulator [Bryobacteraceae bacterium]|nr:response regulator [Bryobacteraceae bacterium]
MSIAMLIVDDSPAMRNIIRRTVTLSGLPANPLLEAANGAEALELMRRRPVDVVLTDINMPVMNGEEMLATMDADEALRGVPVVVISTDSTEARRSRMLGLGARGYIRKPFQPEVLRDELERVLVERPDQEGFHV